MYSDFSQSNGTIYLHCGFVISENLELSSTPSPYSTTLSTHLHHRGDPASKLRGQFIIKLTLTIRVVKLSIQISDLNTNVFETLTSLWRDTNKFLKQFV